MWVYDELTVDGYRSIYIYMKLIHKIHVENQAFLHTA